MRLSAAENREVIRLVEGSDLSVRRCLWLSDQVFELLQPSAVRGYELPVWGHDQRQQSGQYSSSGVVYDPIPPALCLGCP